MYSKSQLAKKYLRYLKTASNSKGHGIHSPFVFDFVTKVLNDKKKYDCYAPIENIRKQLKHNKNIILTEDFGAGSNVNNRKEKKISTIAKSALKPRKFSRLLFRMANYLKPQNILELGTSLGITTAYLASFDSKVPVITLEGSESIAAVAKENFETLELNNVKIIEGNFDDTLPPTLDNYFSTVDFCFVDGNHRKEPTLNYFNLLLTKTHQNSVIIFDDIHWSSEMEDAWKNIKTHSSVTLSIDLFFIGIIFFRKQQIIKQHFTIRF